MIGEARRVGVVLLDTQVGLMVEQAVEHVGRVAHADVDHLGVEVMEHFGLTVPLNQARYYETEPHKELMKDIRGAINEGRLIAVCGLIGSGKTVTLRRLQQMLEDEKKVTVSRSLAIDKHSVKLATLLAALFMTSQPRRTCGFRPVLNGVNVSCWSC